MIGSVGGGKKCKKCTDQGVILVASTLSVGYCAQPWRRFATWLFSWSLVFLVGLLKLERKENSLAPSQFPTNLGKNAPPINVQALSDMVVCFYQQVIDPGSCLAQKSTQGVWSWAVSTANKTSSLHCPRDGWHRLVSFHHRDQRS